MSETQWTPGPWESRLSSIMARGSVDTFDGSVLGSIAQVFPLHDEDAEGREWQAPGCHIANGQLIAAAPELYEALEQTNRELNAVIEQVNAMLKAQITSSDLQPPDYLDQQTVHENEMLLAKARGEA